MLHSETRSGYSSAISSTDLLLSESRPGRAMGVMCCNCLEPPEPYAPPQPAEAFSRGFSWNAAAQICDSVGRVPCDASLIRSGAAAKLDPDLDTRLVWTNTLCNPDRAPFAQPKPRVVIDQCNFDGNGARYNGGAIAITSGEVSINNCTFQRNSAASGAAIAVAGIRKDQTVHLTVGGSVFQQNHLRVVPMGLPTGGAAVRLGGLGTINSEFERCIFAANWFGHGKAASGSAMLVDATEASLRIASSSFVQNWGAVQSTHLEQSSTSSHGALVVSSGTVMLEGTSFEQNNAHGASEALFDLAFNTYENWCALGEAVKRRIPGFTPRAPVTACSSLLSGERQPTSTRSHLIDSRDAAGTIAHLSAAPQPNGAVPHTTWTVQGIASL